MLRYIIGFILSSAGGLIGAMSGIPFGAFLGTMKGGNLLKLEQEFLKPMHSFTGHFGSVVREVLINYIPGDETNPQGRTRVISIIGGIAGGATGWFIGMIGFALAGVESGWRLAEILVEPIHRIFEGRNPNIPEERSRTNRRRLPKPTASPVNCDQHHWYYNQHVMKLLARDAEKSKTVQGIYELFESDESYLEALQQGGWELDTFMGEPFPNINLATLEHFREPFFPGLKSASRVAREAYDEAIEQWQNGNEVRAVYYLGASTHIIQDIAFPQHAVRGVSFLGKMLGHQMMERWTEVHHRKLYPDPVRGGRYPPVNTPEAFVEYVGTESANDYRMAVYEALLYVQHRQRQKRKGKSVRHGNQDDFQSTIYRKAVTRAVRCTTGYFAMFFREVGL